MRKIGALILAVGMLGCESAKQATKRAPSPSYDLDESFDRHVEYAVRPTEVMTTAPSKVVFDFALREVVAMGFDIVFSNPSSGVLTATQSSFDEFATHTGSQTMARGDHLDVRHLTLAVAVGPERATVTAQVRACLQRGGLEECEPARNTLRAAELAAANQLVQAMSSLKAATRPRASTEL